MPNNIQRVAEYYIGKNRAIAILENQEHLCPLLKDADIVMLFNLKTLDFDNDQIEAVKGIKTDGYFEFYCEI